MTGWRILSLMAIACWVLACENSDYGASGNASSSQNSAQTQSSSTAAAASHNPGQNCMSSGCHNAGGAGPQFTVAGTVYRSGTSSGLAGASVKLYLHNQSTLLAELISDSSGNFYTQQTIEGLGSGGVGVDPELNGVAMPGLISNGSCNACHGNGNGRLTSS